MASPTLAQEANKPVDGDAALPGTGLDGPLALAIDTPTMSGSDDERLVPLGGDILPYAGNIRTFAGPFSGSAGNIRTFSGDATASAGNIRTFAGNIRTFAGNIRTFQGDVLSDTTKGSAFWGSLYPASGTLVANAGNIRTFAGQFEGLAGNIRTFAGNIRTFDGPLLSYADATPAYDGLNAQLVDLVATSKAQWGSMITTKTGKSFEEAFSNKLLGKYGINLSSPQSLVGLNEAGVELFLLDWYDNLSLYSGTDIVDHWMSAINWTPRLTQDLGSGRDSKIGLLDFTVTGEGASNVVKAAGVSAVSGIHGSAVASLMIGAHDGRGVMGIAPGASVVSYNPFDETYTAGWADIQRGVRNLVDNKATIINMSLGIPGWTLNPGWNDVFSSDEVSKEAKKRVFVLAAGNDGITQTQNVEWKFDKNPSIIVVGSVDPSGNISEFSNRPGTVCLTDKGQCKSATNLLLNNFIVAPGEFILVSDGQGGVTRLSGTSFAAPLVSGTVALIHDRWPWLRDRPQDTVDIILSSAKDLGDPGPDEVYGRGELDVGAALSPKALNALKFKVATDGSKFADLKLEQISTSARSEMIQKWEASGAYLSAFDDTLSSYRDFLIPLSSKLVGQSVGKSREQFASYLQSRFLDWFRTGGTTTSTGPSGPAPRPFAWNSGAASLASVGSFEGTVSVAQRPYRPGLRQSSGGIYTSLALRDPSSGVGLKFGSGPGAPALGQPGFQLTSDYDLQNGGANPYLGLASGGGFVAADVPLGGGFSVSSGITQDRRERDLDQYGLDDRLALGSARSYSAIAGTMTLAYRAAPWMTTSVAYIMLDETSGLLGTQSTDRNDLAGGTTTDAVTGAVDFTVTPTLSLTASATMGRTRSGDLSRQNIAVSDGGLMTSAYQATLTKAGLVGNDRLRLTLSQPMHVESGSIDLSNVQVIDRATGELGVVVQSFALNSGRRRIMSEMIYGRTIGDGLAEVSLFGKANLRGRPDATEASLTIGSGFALRF